MSRQVKRSLDASIFDLTLPPLYSPSKKQKGPPKGSTPTKASSPVGPTKGQNSPSPSQTPLTPLPTPPKPFPTSPKSSTPTPTKAIKRSSSGGRTRKSSQPSTDISQFLAKKQQYYAAFDDVVIETEVVPSAPIIPPSQKSIIIQKPSQVDLKFLKNLETSISFAYLPYDILIHVFSYFTDSYTVLCCSLTCCSWYEASCEENVWFKLFVHVWPYEELPEKGENTWKQVFLKKRRQMVYGKNKSNSNMVVYGRKRFSSLFSLPDFTKPPNF
eukprot:TRINITY_DN10437_c0_g1_i1.p1 TRINITY_DN10437_c0_g1~~TRINITY_DN10437_c0_g1_i1.p1  ORF type:complete len:271 (+),score=78.56 TRINITY_DN10437_c0_g1_i1:50-862(+)